VTVVRIVLWSLGDSQTTVAELLAALPDLDPPSRWIWNDAAERFGMVAFDDEIEAYDRARELIGKKPEAAEEFDA
jgi:hypothetical protein